MSNHETNAWIESQWKDQSVKQVGGIPNLIGRTGKVAETFWDENGALHCRMECANGDWWCPAALLEKS